MALPRKPCRTGLLRTVVLLFASACDGSIDPRPPAVTAMVEVTGVPSTVEVGNTVQLAATARDASGNPLAGKSFTWASSDETVARVTAGLVTAVAPGSAKITASTDRKSGSGTVVVSPVPVASVVVSPDTATLAVGGTRQLSTSVRDAAGNTLSGRRVTWSSSDTAKAKVSQTGLVTAIATGGATISATSENKAGHATITVFVPAASRIAVSPPFATLDVGQTATSAASILNAAGQPIPGATATWRSLATNVATVDPASGRVTAVAVGQARIVAQSGTAADTALLAVLGARSALSTAFAGGSIRTNVTPGQTITIPVTLDLRRVSAIGDLGAVELEVSYDATVLEFQNATKNVFGGTAESNVTQPGHFRFAFVTTDPQQQNAVLALVTLTFRVAASVPVGTQRTLTIRYPSRPADTNLNQYEPPIAVGGTIRLVSP